MERLPRHRRHQRRCHGRLSPREGPPYLYRRIPATGKWRRITRALVPAQFGRPGGATYRVVDRTAPTGRRLTYRLKEVCFGSETNWYGPYSVKP